MFLLLFRSHSQVPALAADWASRSLSSLLLSASSLALRGEISRAMVEAPVTCPRLSLIGEIVRAAWNV